MFRIQRKFVESCLLIILLITLFLLASLSATAQEPKNSQVVSPVLISTERYARDDLILQGVTIPRGGMTLGVIGSANRDESVFENPDGLDIAREPNKQLAFGQGIHFCLGAPLARFEGAIASNTLLRRMPDLHLRFATESLRWLPSMVLRGLESLPVSFGVVVS